MLLYRDNVCFGFSFFFQAEDGIRDKLVTGVQTCALPISDVGVPDFRTITDAAERLVSDRDILLRLDQPGHDAEHGGRDGDAAHPRLFHSLTPLKSPNGWLARNASVSMRRPARWTRVVDIRGGTGTGHSAGVE